MISQMHCILCQGTGIITLSEEMFLQPVAPTWIFSFTAPHLTTPPLPTQVSSVTDGAHVADTYHQMCQVLRCLS